MELQVSRKSEVSCDLRSLSVLLVDSGALKTTILVFLSSRLFSYLSRSVNASLTKMFCCFHRYLP